MYVEKSCLVWVETLVQSLAYKMVIRETSVTSAINIETPWIVLEDICNLAIPTTILTQKEIILVHTIVTNKLGGAPMIHLIHFWKAQFISNKLSIRTKIQDNDQHWNAIQYDSEVADNLIDMFNY